MEIVSQMLSRSKFCVIFVSLHKLVLHLIGLVFAVISGSDSISQDLGLG